MFVFSIVVPAAGIPLVASLGLEAAIIAAVSGGLLIGAEVLGWLAIAIMGKPGYEFIKTRVFGYVKQYGPAKTVSPGRYRVGLVLFFAPILFGWLAPYMSELFPGLTQYALPAAIAGDVLWLAGIFVLGGDFWAKIRALFVYSDTVVSLREDGVEAAAR